MDGIEAPGGESVHAVRLIAANRKSNAFAELDLSLESTDMEIWYPFKG